MLRIGSTGLTVLVLAALGVAGLTAPAAGQDMVDEGSWIQLFDGESTFGWTAFGDAEWEIKDGSLYCREGWSGFLATTSRFSDFDLEVSLMVEGAGSVGLGLRTPLAGHWSENGGTALVLRESEDMQKVSIRAEGASVAAKVNGEAVEVAAPANLLGHITLMYHRYHSGRTAPKVTISEVKLRPLNLKPVFDGESLDGWNIIPDRQSKFAVVDGAINITDGNGQIETDAVFRDFVLQIDVISNGEHLNSGVFFRGPKGIFWKGYESQVRNQWMKDDQEKPVDYGTGGVYGVDPARKVVSTDGEWFTKTVVCEGNHIAVWIDGYQVSDFYDTRPVVDNGDGKNGFVPEAGTIHLQGHDPTTDLSFKNIHVQTYPED